MEARMCTDHLRKEKCKNFGRTFTCHERQREGDASKKKKLWLFTLHKKAQSRNFYLREGCVIGTFSANK